LYFGSKPIQSISWQTYDRPPLWGDPDDFSFGIHYFSDFLVPYQWNQHPNPYLIDPPTNYLPVANSIFRVLGFIPYRTALIFFQLIGIALTVLVLIWSTKFLGRLEQASVVLVGMASQGVIAAVDRGNLQLFFTLPLFIFGLSVLRRQESSGNFSVALLTSLKGYPIFLYLLLLRQHNVRRVFRSLMLVAISSFALIASLPGSINESVSGLLRFASFYGNNEDAFWVQNTTSFSSGISQLSNMFLGHKSSIAVFIRNHQIYIALSVFLWIVFVVVVQREKNRFAKMILVLSTTQMLIPVSFYYTKIWAVAALGLLFVRHWPEFRNTREFQQSARTEYFVSVFIFISLAPIWISGEHYNIGTVLNSLAFIALLVELTIGNRQKAISIPTGIGDPK
jgi:hypothetical protein